MKIKMTILLFLVLALEVVSFSSCSYKTTYTDIKDYSEVWKLSGHNLIRSECYSTISPLFVSNIDKRDIKEFYCGYEETLPVGESFQIYLSVAFEDNEFAEEIGRLSDEFETLDDEFEIKTYVSVFGWNDCYEYAAVDEQKKEITYIYLQYIDYENIRFDKSLLPKDYAERETAHSMSYNIYLKTQIKTRDGTLS